MSESNGKVAHLDLGEFGFPSQWVDLHDPRFMSERKFQRVVEEIQDPASQNDPKKLHEFLRGRIAAWHVLDADSGEAMDDPQTADMAGLPLGARKPIVEKVFELFGNQAPDLASRRAPGPGSS